MSLEVEIREFIVKNFLFGEDDGSLHSEDSLIERGVVDSSGVLEVVGFLDERFGVEVADHELVPSNFDSITKLAAFIERKRAARTAA